MTYIYIILKKEWPRTVYVMNRLRLKLYSAVNYTIIFLIDFTIFGDFYSKIRYKTNIYLHREYKMVIFFSKLTIIKSVF